MPRVTVFAPNPLLTVTVERRGEGGSDEVHLHAGGQGVWVSRMVAELGATPVLCGFAGGETGEVLGGLLAGGPLRRRLIPSAGATGCYVMDRRDGTRRLIALAESPPPSRHELDDLVAATCATALAGDVLVVCNPFPADAVPVEAYGDLVSDVRANGTPVVVDLSCPHLDAVLQAGPDLVKLNDWELAQFVTGPVDPPARLRAAAERLRAAGARSVLVTRGPDPALWLDGHEAWTVTPPRFARGRREGCGDTMVGAIAAMLASGAPLAEAVRMGAAAGAANFLRRGLGTGSREVVEALAGHVGLQPAA